ncbi:hypothetical protein MLP_39480 [Microlunatus phosphovorus NM-1]|uniref:Ribonuclease VapC n=1 Tax=Microlunatus phosphovorus (strain ATCC 700054 / DSM 10555 / JCM 9379 / NBRC 101784 / NCIMB 13414 / VKM Ac-1990 / NM-1) TaxID=1032480 RepID=F5XQU0_MICPN|nr:type II toxin-antitoxin system VapC family toxin [Microlunatus phosphovorus]BAK36962.1 hypothetical protein MLP_39480 [Microlunatus phosphovorus NM-1]
MPTSAELLLLDTSAAVALVDPDHVAHDAVRDRVRGHRLGLAGHAEFETFSVLTRLPGAKRVAPEAAIRLIQIGFPETRHLSRTAAELLLTEVGRRGVAGGAVYDALVAAAAGEHALLLVSRDARAMATYRAMGIDAELVGLP